jgi:type II restriction-modification system restriction subunit
MRYILQKGFKSINGQIEILDSDSLCYLVKNNSKGISGIRTISKALLEEYVDYFEKHPHNTSQQARDDLTGKTAIDKFEYGYTSTLTTMARMVIGDQLSSSDKTLSIPQSKVTNIFNQPFQLIYYGAPGTGKSYRIKQICQKYEHYRITFHPDTDYASFVGSYKPITHSEQVYTNMGDKAIPLKDSVTGEPVTTTKITYQYVYQAFLNAYIAAWKEQQNENPSPVFLVIEEINRGNCAQIFGDIFQLLDRNENGFSDYPIIADNDLKKELAKEFETLDVFNAENINGIYDDDIIAKIKSGSHLLLPNNLYIWATMNTSDQSLFPIDSAFKRRWDWKYVKIADSGKNYRISVNKNEYDWWEFVEAINSHIGIDTDQEDKKLGYFFAKATKNNEGKYIISADTFLSKVIFFIYNDVYKDFGFDDDIFKDEDGEVLTFANYFNQYGDTVYEKVERFIRNLGLKPISLSTNVDVEATEIDEIFDDSTSSENREIVVDSVASSRNNSFTAITQAALKQSAANGNSLTIDDLTLIAQSSFLTPSGKQMKKKYFLKEIDKDEYLTSSNDQTAKDRYKFQIPLTDTNGETFYAWADWGVKAEPSLARYADSLNVKVEGFNRK